MEKIKSTLKWVRLDNAAKIYPAARRKNWSNVFRQSITLNEEVDIKVLKSALTVTVQRFPTIAARLRRGLFWYYLQQIEFAPEISEEKSYPLDYMSKEEMRKCAFRVIVYYDRIAVEFFHSLTDGTGALVFLKSLVAEYLEQKHGISIPFEYGILDRKASVSQEEIEDSFLRYAGEVKASRKATNAWKLPKDKQNDNSTKLTCFHLSVNQIIELAHKHNVTFTVFLGAVMMMALQDMQKEKVQIRRKRKPIKLLIPVNLRNVFQSKTLRNFAMFTIPEIDPRMGEYSFDEICNVIKHKMGEEITPKHMGAVIATNVKDERNLLLRLVPLPIKNLVMKAVFNSVGECKSCLTMSNLGQIKLPEIMVPYVKRIDFILGVQADAPYNCGVLSFCDTVDVNFIRNTKEAELERCFYGVLRKMGITAKVESNG